MSKSARAAAASLSGGERGVHRGGDAGDRAGVLHLQAVDGARPNR